VGRRWESLIRSGEAPHSPGRCRALRDQEQPAFQTAGGGAEKRMKSLETRPARQLLAFPNYPFAPLPGGTIGSRQHRGAVAGERPARAGACRSTGKIAERLGLIDSERSVRIAQSRFVTLLGPGRSPGGGRPDQPDARLHGRQGYRRGDAPILVTAQALMGSGQLPKFAGRKLSLPPTTTFSG